MQDFLAVRDEQHPFGAALPGVEGGEPGLAEAGGQHHQAPLIALGARIDERLQGLALDRSGNGRRLDFLLYPDGRQRGRLLAPGFVGVDPRVGQRLATRLGEQRLETEAGVEKTIVAGIIDAVVPLQAIA